MGLTLNLHTPADKPGGHTALASLADSLGLSAARHHRYDVRNVTFMLADPETAARLDTVDYNGIKFVYGADRYIRPKVLDEMCLLQPGKAYSATDVERTYEALGRLAIIRYINIDMTPAGAIGDTGLLDATIHLARNKKMTASVELEGTNSEGDFGFGLGLTYQHRNLAHGSEMLTTKLRGSYESLSGNLDGLINNRYTEFAG